MADFLSEYCAVILTFDLLTSNLFHHLLMKSATSCHFWAVAVVYLHSTTHK